MHILHIQTIKAVQDFSSDDWRNKFVIEFRGEEGMNECVSCVQVTIFTG